ncbi:hypothetical protein MG293_001573 [Ovis ammon polii]|uniref:Uncharacterized protein n=1 Tax=Ovis ammon polii TaxID=230172 RepID=A0AAD4UL92_OVIAM|nr:hypothetical protein MG293_001573 [Ovis ammon polii]
MLAEDIRYPEKQIIVFENRSSEHCTRKESHGFTSSQGETECEEGFLEQCGELDGKALHSIAYSFIELDKAVIHVISWKLVIGALEYIGISEKRWGQQIMLEPLLKITQEFGFYFGDVGMPCRQCSYNSTP